MKKTLRTIAAAIAALLTFGCVGALAEEPLDIAIAPAPVELIETADEIEYAPYFLIVEGPDEMLLLDGGEFAAGLTTVGDIVAAYAGDLAIEGLETGYVSSIAGIENGMFGGWDGWQYACKFMVADEETGGYMEAIDLPSISMNDYDLYAPCVVTLFYADYQAPMVGMEETEDGRVQMLSMDPLFDENYKHVGFSFAPLPDAEIAFTKINELDGTIVANPVTVVYTADENGVIDIPADFEQLLTNGLYVMNAGFEGEDGLQKAVRLSDLYLITNGVPEDDPFVEKVFLLLL